ncbi:MAG: hypothetical protein M3381_00510 [Actinomycetota bacterium]|nr:hypothetical protein [Actinomycetota bacterium]MDQ3714527.1 hypothetical protein [Actinomycetota bacterium]
MNSLNNWRKHRKAARTRRAIEAALMRAPGPAMRDELLTLANREGISINR